jgi:AraC-like DNA-binding protein
VVCQVLYADPADPRGTEEWGQELGMSGRTLARRFETGLGMSLRSWRRRLRLFKAIELLSGGLGVTQTATQLGYGSTSAFIHAFRTDMGSGPQTYMRGRGADRGAPWHLMPEMSRPKLVVSSMLLTPVDCLEDGENCNLDLTPDAVNSRDRPQPPLTAYKQAL